MEQPQYHLAGVMRSNDDEAMDFTGPLDVILLLLAKNKIEISDISISTILEQYLAYLDEMKRMDMEIASEFIAMASRLMLIKTKMLLSVSEQQEAQDEMDTLIQALEERQRQEAREQIRTAVQFLEQRGEIGRSLFVKEPEPYQRDRTYRYQHEPEDLLSALRQIADRNEQRLPPTAVFQGVAGREVYPVAKKVSQLLGRLVKAGRSKFRQLFRGCRTRSEIVATFLAVLELCKLKNVELGPETDGEPSLIYHEPEEAADGTE